MMDWFLTLTASVGLAWTTWAALDLFAAVYSRWYFARWEARRD